MQTAEALISFTFFLFFATFMLTQLDYAKPGYALYEYQLANDAWRVLYLKGALNDFKSGSSTAALAMEEIGAKTGFCLYAQGVQTTNCRNGQACSYNRIMLHKIWFDHGVPKQLDFTVCVPR